jgi:hypothetical protein
MLSFLQWSASDSVSNTLGGMLAACIVALALGAFGEQIMQIDTLVKRGHSEGDEGYWQRVVQYWKEGVGS